MHIGAAIEQANANPGLDTIRFAVPAVHPSLIFLPSIDEALTIDGEGKTELSGAELLVYGGGVLIRGMTINDVLFSGIYLGGIGGDIVEGNRIGTDISGTVALGHAVYGIAIASPNNLIGGTSPGARNLISGNGSGVVVMSSGNQILGNSIGTDSSGTRAIGNDYGIQVGGPDDPSDEIIGGSVAAEGNLIAGNTVVGILLNKSPSHILVEGNTIGASLGNGETGVYVWSHDNYLINNTITGSLEGIVIDGSQNLVSDNAIHNNVGIASISSMAWTMRSCRIPSPIIRVGLEFIFRRVRGTGSPRILSRITVVWASLWAQGSLPMIPEMPTWARTSFKTFLISSRPSVRSIRWWL